MTVDIESEFYKILGAQTDLPSMSLKVEQDMFDSSQGSQSGINAAGNIVLLTVVSPAVARELIRAWDMIQNHFDADDARDTIMAHAYVSNMLLQHVRPHLGKDTA